MIPVPRGAGIASRSKNGETLVKSLLKLVVLGVIVLAVVGWFRGWYSLSHEKDANNHEHVDVDVNTDKVRSDFDVVLAKSRNMLDKAGDALKSAKDKASKASGDQKTQLDRKISDLEATRDSLQNRLEQLNRKAADQTDLAKQESAHQIADLEKQIADLDAAIQKALSSH